MLQKLNYENYATSFKLIHKKHANLHATNFLFIWTVEALGKGNEDNKTEVVPLRP